MNVAILGLGFMGATHSKAWLSVKGATLAGVMSSNPAKLTGDLSSVGGNLGGTAQAIDFGNASRFTSLEEALADPKIEAVDICLSTDLHASATLAALRAGKHILVEKPMALHPADAQAMCNEAHRAGRILMAAHVLRFIPAYRNLASWLKDRKIESALFRRQCGKPAWLTDISKTGGAVLDLLIHDIDFCISQWGMPQTVQATGTEDLIRAELTYRDLGAVVIEGGWHQPSDFPFSMEYGVTSGSDTLRWSSADPVDPNVPATDPFAEELQYFADCVNAGKQPAFCPPEESARSIALARFMLESRNHNGTLVRTS